MSVLVLFVVWLSDMRNKYKSAKNNVFSIFSYKKVQYLTKPNLAPSFGWRDRKKTHSYLDYCQFPLPFMRKLLTGYTARKRART